MPVVDWVSVILAAALAFNGIQNMLGVEFARQAFEKFGHPRWFLTTVGVAELVAAAGMLMPGYRLPGLLLAILCLLGAVGTLIYHRLWRPVEYPLVLLCLAFVLTLAT